MGRSLNPLKSPTNSAAVLLESVREDLQTHSCKVHVPILSGSSLESALADLSSTRGSSSARLGALSLSPAYARAQPRATSPAPRTV